MQDVRLLLRRELQLNVLAYIIIISLMVVVSLFGAMILAGLGAQDLWLLTNQFARILIPGLLLAVVLYMADTHRRLRAALRATHDQLADARDELKIAYDRVSFAHDVATTMASVSESEALPTALKEAVKHFQAEAAAIVTDENDIEVVAEDEEHVQAARSAALGAALRTVQSGTSQLLSQQEHSYKIASTPLRMNGRLHAVACLLRHDEPFSEEDREGLELLARVLELSIQNKHLLANMRSQLRGVLTVLSSLIEQRQRDYTAHSVEVANHAFSIGQHIHMTERDLEDLKVAALLHDIGMLYVPQELLNAQRDLTPEERAEVQQHAENGARLAGQASFDSDVQNTILSHHERFDGRGYPRGLSGREIPLAARIIAVCDSFDAMTRERPYRHRLSGSEAAAELRRGAGTAYDPKVVKAFLEILEQRVGLAALAQSATQASRVDATLGQDLGRSA